LLHKFEAYEKKGWGVVVIKSKRLPFRLFSLNPDRVLYKPDFPEAKWHELDTEKIDAEVLFSREDAFQTMAYIRSVQGF
jgi:hypothetical protein